MSQLCSNCLCKCYDHGPDGCMKCRCELKKRQSELYLQVPRSCVQCVHMDRARLKEDTILLVRDHAHKDDVGNLTKVPAGSTVGFCSFGYWEGVTHVDEPKKLSRGRPISSLYIDQATACDDFEQRDSRFRLVPVPEDKPPKPVKRDESEEEYFAMWGQSKAWDSFIDGIEDELEE